MMKFDLHMHTTRHSPDSNMDPFDLVRKAQELKLDGVVITEHDWLWTDEELNELRTAAPGLVVLAGIEVGAREGHFLVYGVNDPFLLPVGIPVKELCREVHRQGGAVVTAHPFRWGQPFDEILSEESPGARRLGVNEQQHGPGVPKAHRPSPAAIRLRGPRQQQRASSKCLGNLLHRVRRRHPRQPRPGRRHPGAPHHGPGALAEGARRAEKAPVSQSMPGLSSSVAASARNRAPPRWAVAFPAAGSQKHTTRLAFSRSPSRMYAIARNSPSPGSLPLFSLAAFSRAAMAPFQLPVR